MPFQRSWPWLCLRAGFTEDQLRGVVSAEASVIWRRRHKTGFLPQIPQKDADALWLDDRVPNVANPIESSAVSQFASPFRF